MPTYAPLDVDRDIYGEIGLQVCANINAAVSGSSQRNAQCLTYDEQMYMRQVQLKIKRWRNSCDLNSSMMLSLGITLHAQIMQAIKRDPKWMVDAHDPDDDDSARTNEDFLNNKAQQYRLNRVLEDVAWNAIRDDVSVLYAGWKQHLGYVEKTKYRLRGEKDWLPVEAEDREEGKTYDPVRTLDPGVEREGCDVRPVELMDFYMYPANAEHVQEWETRGAVGVGERIYFSRQQLLDGIGDYDYDENAVYDLIQSGATDFSGIGGDDLRQRDDDFNGVSSGTTRPQDGFWECFIWFQRLPSDLDIPQEYLRRDAMIVCCPVRNIVLKIALSPYNQRPYIPFYIKRKPGNFLGTGLCQMLSQLHEEDTTSIRQDIDAMDLYVCAPHVCSPTDYAMIERQQAQGPGTYLIEEVPGTIRQLTQQPPSQFGVRSGYTNARAQGLISAEGYGDMQQKVRKAAEVQAVVGAADAKFELYLSTFQEGMCDLAPWILVLEATFGGDKQTFRDARGRPAKITSQQMEGRYTFTATATSTTANPQARLQLAQARAAEQTRYMGLMNTAPPAMWPDLWQASRAILLDYNTRRPEDYIGPEPQQPPPMAPNMQTFIQILQSQGADPKVIAASVQAFQQQQALAVNMQSAAQGVLNPGAPPGGVA